MDERNSLAQRFEAGPGRHSQFPTPSPKRGVQRGERVVEPPAAGGPRGTLALFLGRVHIKGHDTIVGGNRGVERGMVGKTKVATEPDDGCTHRHSIHGAREMRIVLHLCSVSGLRLCRQTTTSKVVPKELP